MAMQQDLKDPENGLDKKVEVLKKQLGEITVSQSQLRMNQEEQKATRELVKGMMSSSYPSSAPAAARRLPAS